MTAATHLRRVALGDQLEAGLAENRRRLAAIAMDRGGSQPARSVTQADRHVMRMFAQSVANGLTLCPHLAASAPGPGTWWTPTSPSRLWCGSCAEPVLAARDDRPLCDGCSTPIVEPAHVALTALPGLILGRAGGDDVVVPSVLVLAQHCRPCASAA